MNTSLAILPALLLAASPAVHHPIPQGRPTSREVLGTARIVPSPCHSDQLMLGGQCLAKTAIKALVTGKVTALGSCKLRLQTGQISDCDVHLTEVVNETTEKKHATLKMVTWLLTGETCSGSTGCLKGHKVGAKFITTLALDGSARTWSGEMSMYTWFTRAPMRPPSSGHPKEGGPTALPAKADRAFMKAGSGTFTGDMRRTIAEMYAANGGQVRRTAQALQTSALSSPTPSFLEEVCKKMMDELGDDAGDLAGDGAGSLIKAGIGKLAGYLTTEALEAGPAGWLAAPFIYFGGEGVAHVGGYLGGVVVKSVTKTIVSRWDLPSFCEKFAPPSPPPPHDPGPGPGDFPRPPDGHPPDLDPNAVICAACKQFKITVTHTSVPSETDADGVETVTVVADKKVKTCSAWAVQRGADSNADGYCD